MPGKGVLTSGGKCAICAAFLPSGSSVEWFEKDGKNRFRHPTPPGCPARSDAPGGAGTSAPSGSGDWSATVELTTSANPDFPTTTLVRIARLRLNSAGEARVAAAEIVKMLETNARIP